MRTILLAAAAAALLLPSTASAAGFEPIPTSGLGLTRTGLGDADYGRVARLEAKYPRDAPAGSMQGALMLNGKIGSSASAGQGSPGVFTTGAPGATPTRHPWAAGVKDVSCAATSGRIHSLTESSGASCAASAPRRSGSEVRIRSRA